jgi:hypothetical protein
MIPAADGKSRRAGGNPPLPVSQRRSLAQAARAAECRGTTARCQSRCHGDSGPESDLEFKPQFNLKFKFKLPVLRYYY